MSSWAVELAQAMKQQNGSIKLMLGVVSSVKPLAIRVKGVTICKQLYVNPAYIVLTEQEISKAFQSEQTQCPQIFDYLHNWHKQYTLKPNDAIIVMQIESIFYIVEKVVQA